MPFTKVLRTENLELSKITQNSALRAQNCKAKGFTLIEILVVLGILVITVSSTLLFLTSVLRGSNKANVYAEVKQNGQSVLDSLERQVRNAVDAQQISVEGLNTIKLTRQDQNPLYIICKGSDASHNGYIGTLTLVAATDPDPTSSGSFIALTNKDDVNSGVDLDCISDAACKLQVIPPSSGSNSPPIVSLCFYANQATQAPSRQDFLVGLKFKTTISLRKY